MMFALVGSRARRSAAIQKGKVIRMVAQFEGIWYMSEQLLSDGFYAQP
jgi:hypothetical protein